MKNNSEQLYQGISHIDKDLITEAEYAPTQRKAYSLPRIASFAACFFVLIVSAIFLTQNSIPFAPNNDVPGLSIVPTNGSTTSTQGSDNPELPPTDYYWNPTNNAYANNSIISSGKEKTVSLEDMYSIFGYKVLPDLVLNQYTLSSSSFNVLVDAEEKLVTGYPVSFSYYDATGNIAYTVHVEKTTVFDISEIYSHAQKIRTSFINSNIGALFIVSDKLLQAQFVVLSPVSVDETGDPERFLLTISSDSLSQQQFISVITDLLSSY